MQRAVFDYPYTCPTIDRGIQSMRRAIKDHIENSTSQLVPFLNSGQIEEWAEDGLDGLIDELADIFEQVRESNEEMREAAEAQIKALIDENAELEARLADLEYQGG